MSDLIISVSGLRGIVGSSLTPEVVVRYVASYASNLKQRVAERAANSARPRVVVGRDGRDSGPVLRDLVAATLQASGCDCLDADVIATPTVGVFVREAAADGAIQITASHNPPPYNGMKLFSHEGRVLDAVSGGRIASDFAAGTASWAAHDAFGELQRLEDPHATHLAAVLATVDRAKIAGRRYRVLLDSNHGSGSMLGRRLLEQLGCEAVVTGGEPDGRFEHVPEPTADNLESIASRVADERCAVGFCQDPDADRLALIDESGRYVGEECTLALCVRRVLADPATRGPIVINGATSNMSEVLAEQAGVPAFRSAVGEANVVDRMREANAAYGGEGNGGPIDPRVGWVRDSFVGIAQVLDLMAVTGEPLSRLVDSLPQFAIHKSKVTVDAERLPTLLGAIEAANPDAQPAYGDGLRLAWPDAWLLVRGSNTEPIVRLIAEAPTAERAAALCESAAKLIADHH